MKHIIIRICFLLLICSGSYGQQTHFIYLQTETRDPFYVLLNKKNYSSSSIGYVILPRLANGDYDLYIGFPKKDGAEQPFSIRVKDNDQGFLLKDFGDKGWGIFNLQSLAVQYAGEARQKMQALAAAEAKRIAGEQAQKTADSLAVVEARQKQEALAAAELKRKTDEAAKKTADSLAIVEAKQQAEILAAVERKRKADELAAKQMQDSLNELETKRQAMAAAEIKRKNDDLALKKQQDSIAAAEVQQQKEALVAAEQQKKRDAITLKRQKDSIAAATAQQQKDALAAADLQKKAGALALKKQKDSLAIATVQQQKDALAAADLKKKTDALALKKQKDSLAAENSQQQKDALAAADLKKKTGAVALKKQQDSIAAAAAQQQQDAIAAADQQKKAAALALQNEKDSLAAVEATQKQEALQAAEAKRKADELALQVARDSVKKADALAAQQKMRDSLKVATTYPPVPPNDITLSSSDEKVTVVKLPKMMQPALVHSAATDSGFVYKYALSDGNSRDTISVFIKGKPPVGKQPEPVVVDALPALEKAAEPGTNSNGVKFLDMNFNQDSGVAKTAAEKLPVPDKQAGKKAEKAVKPAKDETPVIADTSHAVIMAPKSGEPVIKIPAIPNSNCKATANEKDFFALRKKMAAQETADDMIVAAKKGMKEKCYLTQQIRNLSVLFLNDAERYQFLDAAYPFAFDAENYAALADLLIDPYYKERFRVMIRR